MRIVFNARILQTARTGIGHYLCELVSALQMQQDMEIHLFDGRIWRRDIPSPAHPGSISGAQSFKSLAQKLPFAYATRRAIEQRRFNRAARANPVDIYHDPSLWPLDFNGPTVMTVHDLTHLRYPETQPASRLREINHRLPDSLHNVNQIIVDSQFIADELKQLYDIPTHRVSVAPLGCATRFHPHSEESLQRVLAPFNVKPDHYLICVGTLEPRKNLALALRAHARLPQDLRSRFPLLVVGMPGWKMGQLSQELDSAVRSGQVRLLGYQTDEQVAALVAGARIMMFPSRYEGFGLPVLESMASGTPVMLANQSAMPEVAGTAGIYVPQDDIEAWGIALQNIIENHQMREAFRQRGLDRAREFTWQRCAQLTANVYKRVLNS